jgi:hypothetical protein
MPKICGMDSNTATGTRRVKRRAMLLTLVAFVSAAPAPADDSAAHRANVERNSEMVMPFSMDRTHHIFSPSADGGTQAIVVLDRDPQQIALVRAHLRKESGAFARGDFSDPRAIHGAAMPGLAALQASRGKLHVRYAELSNGAQLVFTSRDPRTIEALHRWFAAQVSDHAGHAIMMKMP